VRGFAAGIKDRAARPVEPVRQFPARATNRDASRCRLTIKRAIPFNLTWFPSGSILIRMPERSRAQPSGPPARKAQVWLRHGRKLTGTAGFNRIYLGVVLAFTRMASAFGGSRKAAAKGRVRFGTETDMTAILNKVATKIFGSANERLLKRLWPVVKEINSLEAEIKGLTDDELRAKTIYFRELIEKRIAEAEINAETPEEEKKAQRQVVDEALDEILPEAFAVVREASRRATGMRHFDVQMI